MSAVRWGAVRTLGSALRTALRPGTPGLGIRLRSVPRLIRASVLGEYRGVSKGRILLVLGALAYVVSPFDLIPEIPFGLFGLADDAVVISWIAATFVNETESFLAWERGSADTPAPAPGGAGATTVQGHVVH